VTESGAVQFRVWAPKRRLIEVESDTGLTALERDNHGYFSGVVPGLQAGSRYRFRLDGGPSFPDPASRYQPDGPHGAAQVIGAIESGDTPVLLDVRTPTDFETSPLRLPGAIRVEPQAVDKPDFTLDVAPEKMIVTYCTTAEEATSAAVAQKLRERGFKRVRILKGGLGGWTNARLPVESKSALPSIGLEIYKSLTLGDLERRRFKAGELVMKEGSDAAGEAFVIHSGMVEVHRTFDGEDRLLGTMGEGELKAIIQDADFPLGLSTLELAPAVDQMWQAIYQEVTGGA